MVAKVRMVHEVITFVEGETEDDIQDWLNEHTPEEIAMSPEYYYEESNYHDEILCYVDGYPNIVIGKEK